jgi:hypothetical protein
MDEKLRLSTLQKKIITHLENEHCNTDTKPNIVKKISKDSHQKSTILKSIKRLEIRKVLIPSKTRNLFTISYSIKPQHIPHTVTLNKKSQIYIRFKERLEKK